MKNDRVNEIDLLRFLAAMAVVFYHYSFRGYAADSLTVMPYSLLVPFSKYGYLGVQIFFMISGFVILMTAARGSLRGFIISRLVRLYPAFWASCTITFVLIVTMGGDTFSASISQYLINMTMLSGFFDVTSIDGAYWSLFVEIKFYMLVTLLLILGRIDQAQLFLVLWLMASIALEILPGDIPLTGRFRSLLIVDFSAFFVAGAAFYLVWSKGISPNRIGIILLSWALAVYQSVAGLPIIEERYNTSMSGISVAAIIAMFFLVMLLVSLRRTGAFGRKRWVSVGALTYPLYLLHQNIGYMIFNFAYPEVNVHLVFWGTIILVIGLAYLVHISIEKKLSFSMKVGLDKLADWGKYKASQYNVRDKDTS
jgi:peptidoglycan/LPS O-acetylase OafA/YrhL